MGIRLLGTLDLSGLTVKGLAAHELSGLAWDEDDQILYAVSDKGYLLHMKPSFQGEILMDIDLVDAYRLRNEKGKPPKHPDAEGMDIFNGNNGVKNDAELLISFEIIPRIIRYSPKGEMIKRYKLPKNLNKINDYDYKNAALESVVIHPELGILTAPQLGLRKGLKSMRSIHDLKGKTWYFNPFKKEDCSTTDLELVPDGSLLILERKFSNILVPFQTILRRVWLDPGDKNGAIKETETIAVLDSTKGWKIDNFEGLAYHKKNRFFMISDDNNNIFQRTLLIYFELVNQVNGKL